jgi:hypothetical protein
MKPSELIASLRACGPQSLSVTLHYIADRYKDLTLENGLYPHDITEHQLVHRQLALAAREPPFAESTAVCMKCFHVHEKDGECGVDLGKGGLCDCKAEVSA